MAVKTIMIGADHETITVEKIEILADKEYRIKYDDNGTEKIIKFDFSQELNIVQHATIGHDKIIWQFDPYPSIIFAIWGHASISRTEQSISTYPTYLFLADGETETPETETATYTAALSYVQKQERAIRAIKEVWRPRKREWMLQAAERADLSAQLVDKVGKWLKSADRAIQLIFQDSTVDPLTVEKVAELASLGANDITDVDTFMRGVHYYAATPTTAILWVSTSGPTRLNLASAVNYGTLPSDYDPTDVSWLVENQPGIITLDDTSPTQGTEITATLSDFDGGVGNITWQWQRRDSNDADWANIANAQASTYTPVAGDVGYQLRATAAYTDNANSNTNDKNTASSAATTAVVASG